MLVEVVAGAICRINGWFPTGIVRCYRSRCDAPSGYAQPWKLAHLGNYSTRNLSGRPTGMPRFDDCNSYALDDGPFLARLAESCKGNSGFREELTTLLQHYRAPRRGP